MGKFKEIVSRISKTDLQVAIKDLNIAQISTAMTGIPTIMNSERIENED